MSAATATKPAKSGKKSKTSKDVEEIKTEFEAVVVVPAEFEDYTKEILVTSLEKFGPITVRKIPTYSSAKTSGLRVRISNPLGIEDFNLNYQIRWTKIRGRFLVMDLVWS